MKSEDERELKRKWLKLQMVIEDDNGILDAISNYKGLEELMNHVAESFQFQWVHEWDNFSHIETDEYRNHQYRMGLKDSFDKDGGL